eukprot:365197-Chlamydomonas_euryale.AAC.3
MSARITRTWVAAVLEPGGTKGSNGLNPGTKLGPWPSTCTQIGASKCMHAHRCVGTVDGAFGIDEWLSVTGGYHYVHARCRREACCTASCGGETIAAF